MAVKQSAMAWCKCWPGAWPGWPEKPCGGRTPVLATKIGLWDTAGHCGTAGTWKRLESHFLVHVNIINIILHLQHSATYCTICK